MANRNRTTSTPRRATAAKAPPNPKEIIYRLEDQASEEAYGIGHLAELMELMGDTVGTPSNRLSSMEQQELGLRIEYLARLIKRHAAAINTALEEIRYTAEQAPMGGAA
jgi:hypothetical protein